MPASTELCPNTQCWTQNGNWVASQAAAGLITCEVKPNCLAVTCGSTSVSAVLSYDLFDEQNVGTYKDDIKAALENGDRELKFAGCNSAGYTLSYGNDGVNVSFDLGSACLTADYDANANTLSYSFSASLDDINSNHAGNQANPQLEFHIDTDITGTCVYDLDITLESDQFWVNQEDVEAAEEGTGQFNDLFECEFSSGGQVLSDDNIVNMGDQIDGKVKSTTNIPGLKYKLTGLTVSQPSINKSFDVFNNANTVGASFPTPLDTLTGNDYTFHWTSFGFQGEFDQNQLQVQCLVSLEYYGN